MEQDRKEQEAIFAKKQRIVEVFEHDPSIWNPLVLDYMLDINDPDSEINQIMKGNRKQKPIETEGVYNSTQLKLAENIPDEKQIDLQSELESLWSELHMPLDQKLDMAIKYGSHKVNNTELAISLWKPVSALIKKREQLLVKIENFEMKASNP